MATGLEIHREWNHLQTLAFEQALGSAHMERAGEWHPGIPLVYLGFAVLMVGGGMSLVSTRQLWAVAEQGQLHVGGLCNRNLTAFAMELPKMLANLPAQP